MWSCVTFIFQTSEWISLWFFLLTNKWPAVKVNIVMTEKMGQTTKSVITGNDKVCKEIYFTLLLMQKSYMICQWHDQCWAIWGLCKYHTVSFYVKKYTFKMATIIHFSFPSSVLCNYIWHVTYPISYFTETDNMYFPVGDFTGGYWVVPQLIKVHSYTQTYYLDRCADYLWTYLPVIKGADDMQHIHGLCPIGHCVPCNPSSFSELLFAT